MYKTINRIMIMLCYFPYLYLVLFYSFVIRAIIKTGRVPSYNNPDPKQLEFASHSKVIEYTFNFMLIGLFLFMVLLVITLSAKKFTLKKIHWKFLAGGIILIVAHLFFDPFFEWFLD